SSATYRPSAGTVGGAGTVGTVVSPRPVGSPCTGSACCLFHQPYSGGALVSAPNDAPIGAIASSHAEAAASRSRVRVLTMQLRMRAGPAGAAMASGVLPNG